MAGSVKPETTDHFFAILEAAMLSPTSCNNASVRSEYQALFSAAQDAKDLLNKRQKNQLAAWSIWALEANDLNIDASFVVSIYAKRSYCPRYVLCFTYAMWFYICWVMCYTPFVTKKKKKQLG